MECEESDEAHIVCGVPLDILLRQGHLRVFSIRTYLDNGTWRAKVHEHIRTTASCTVWFAHRNVHVLLDDVVQHGM